MNMKIKKLNIKDIFYFIKINIFIFLAVLITFPQSYSKPIPPGSGEGDVPANILFLLDSSLSMKNPVTGGTYLGLSGVDWAVELSDGNLIVGEKGDGAVKILTAESKKDTSFANGNINFNGKPKDNTCDNFPHSGNNNQKKKINSESNNTASGAVSSADIVWFGSQATGHIVGIKSDGTCKAVLQTDIDMFKTLEIRRIGGEDILFAFGRAYKNRPASKKQQLGYMLVKNLGANGSDYKGAQIHCDLHRGFGEPLEDGPDNSGNLFNTTKKDMSLDMTVSKNGDYFHFSRKGNLWTFKGENKGNNLWCPVPIAQGGGELATISPENEVMRNKENNKTTTEDRGLNTIYSIRASSDDNDIIYITDKFTHTLQKVRLDIPNAEYEVLVTAGKKGIKTEGTAGTVAASDVSFDEPGRTSSSKIAANLWVSSSTILVGNRNGTIQLFDEDKFTAENKDTSWQAQYGGGKTTRFQGAKEAILEIISDSSLQAGANFGFGHWNGGEGDMSGKGRPSQRYCHKNKHPDTGIKSGSCYYYREDTGPTAGPQETGVPWKGEHPEGTSGMCTKHSCLNVAVHKNGFREIPEVLADLEMAYATDTDAFADLAYGYYTNLDGKTPVINDRRPCQQHYVIVISDGHMFNEERSIPNIKELRTEYSVRTLFVAYGGAYDNVKAKPVFDRFAKAGSCDVDGSAECVPTIKANDPAELKAELDTRIRQIIADRLSFSAPSITASIQEGGAIYQAQFNYEPNGEWRGNLIRKAIRPADDPDDPGGVADSPTYSDRNGKNWNAGDELVNLGSNSRNIWTALDVDQSPEANYVSNWNNWNETLYQEINSLFEETGNIVLDYHNTSSTCKNESGVQDGTIDDQKGIINFLRGKDYFDYNGGCNITEDRGSILADIYHSQLVEVGPPGANTLFTSNNQEAYWRSSKGYAQFKRDKNNRPRLIYAGSNGGMLHAFRASNGREEWAFVPPMVVPHLPLLVNTSMDGAFKKTIKAGGSNAIFGVDGSPVVHDVFIKGLNDTGTAYETTKSWRTLLMIPFGRGGPGFSVLDVTNPTVVKGETNDDGSIKIDESTGNVTGGGSGPLHMFTIYNDTYNNRVIRVDHNGVLNRFEYQDGAFSLQDSLEAEQAINNHSKATADDNDSDTDFTNRDNINACESDDDFDPNFRTAGDKSCYKGKTFTFSNITLPAGSYDATTGVLKDGALVVSENSSGDYSTLQFGPTGVVTGKFNMDSGNPRLTITFSSDKILNAGTGPELSSKIRFASSCEGSGVSEAKFDYSQLGETWSTPRILRVPKFDPSTGKSTGTLDNDRYVAVMGAGYPSSSKCSGSAMFFVDLEGGADVSAESDDIGTALEHEAGKLYGTEILGGPLKIVDSDPDGKKLGLSGTYPTNASPVKNAITAAPVVITADAVGNAPWRGGLVYINDMEGKITKINLTSDKKLFDQQVIMNLKANDTNKRLSFFEMDGAIGSSTGNFWLFGGTGDFNRISEIDDGMSLMDNIVYGIRDFDFPYFVPHPTYPLPISGEADFVSKSMEALEAEAGVPTIEDMDLCIDTTGTNAPTCSLTSSKIGWRYHLGNADGLPTGETENLFRKASAAPTVYRGKVYYPIYEPDKFNNCSLGTAYVCAYDDECGYLDSLHIDSSVQAGNCYEVGAGILSKLVVFGSRLFANLAGPSEQSETLVEILASDKQFRSYRKSWRENF